MITATYTWIPVGATYAKALLDHAQVLVEARVPGQVEPVGQFLGEVVLPVPPPGDTVIPEDKISSEMFVQWVKAANGPENNDIWQANAAADLERKLNPPATFRPMDKP
jgi:hypothetical protein